MLLAQADITNLYNPAANFTDRAMWNISSFLTGCPENEPNCNPTGLSLINLIFFLVGLVFFANLVIAAVTYITSAGSPDKISKAGSRFTTGIIGLVIVFASFVIVRLIAELFGFGAVVPIS